MRFTKLFTLATVALFATSTATAAAPNVATDVTPVTIAPTTLALSVVQDPQPPKTEVKVEITDDRNTVWYADPVWLAVGAMALLVVIVLAVMAARGGDRGGTTVVR